MKSREQLVESVYVLVASLAHGNTRVSRVKAIATAVTAVVGAALADVCRAGADGDHARAREYENQGLMDSASKARARGRASEQDAESILALTQPPASPGKEPL